MLVLVSGATRTVDRLAGHPNLGQLVTPHARVGIRPGLPWAVDNAAFSNWNLQAFLKLLRRVAKAENPPLFVAAPDVVCDAHRTMDKFKDRCLWGFGIDGPRPMSGFGHPTRLVRGWGSRIRQLGLKVAYVAQNGTERNGLPPDQSYDALFIGGDDDYKLSQHVRWLVMDAKRNGKWVHMGRVNSLRRLQHAMDIGCDSVDGTGVSMFPDQVLPQFLRYCGQHQGDLFAGDVFETRHFYRAV